MRPPCCFRSDFQSFSWRSGYTSKTHCCTTGCNFFSAIRRLPYEEKASLFIYHIAMKVSSRQGSSFFRQYLLHPPDFTCFQSDLDAMMVSQGFCQNILHPARRESAGALIFFQHYKNLHARLQVGAIVSIHNDSLACIRAKPRSGKDNSKQGAAVHLLFCRTVIHCSLSRLTPSPRGLRQATRWRNWLRSRSWHTG